MKSNPCQNFNHRRSDAPVRFCPQCGMVVNARVPVKRCSEERHDEGRRHHNLFCVDCGYALRKA
jgi:hypothetical protein